jgi:hypothetical protein
MFFAAPTFQMLKEVQAIMDDLAADLGVEFKITKD